MAGLGPRLSGSVDLTDRPRNLRGVGIQKPPVTGLGPVIHVLKRPRTMA
jgi:hypothetical protein